MNSKAHYPTVDANPDFPKIEEQVIARWKQENAFQSSIDNRSQADEFVFYDGPPFANGLPHYGHLLTGFVKDLYARYQTMRGKKVDRRFGWDCHGLPAEMGSEKELGISGRAAITHFGIDKFNEHCRTSVMKYTNEWEDYVTRQARWVDFKNDYKTMDTNFMESVLWAFKQLYDKGLVYEAYRVMPYSWAAETPLSNFETKLDNSYREREDKAITVAFELKDKPKGAPDADKYYVLAWTTTPWTLPSNLALAVNIEMDYAYVTPSNDGVRSCYLIAASRLSTYAKELNIEENQTPQHVRGNSLIGLTYKPLFPYFKDHPNAFRILDGSSFVTDGDGTGIVHMAPGFGEDDQKCCEANGIEIVVPVDGQGKYTDAIFDLPASSPAPSNTILSTERLYMRPFAADEFALYCTMQSDPKVAATTSDGVLPEEKIKAEFERLQKDQAAKGFTQWAVFRKEDDAFIGRAGFDNRDYDQFNTTGKKPIELRYALLSDYWGNGYATELASALLSWGIAHLKPEIIIAGCNPSYEPAVRLLKKLGFTSYHEVPFRNQNVLYHDLLPENWKSTARTSPALSLKGLNVVAEGDSKFGLANDRIIDYLKSTGQLVKQEQYKHNYPHCWRTDTPLIYRALPSWYVEVTKFRDRAVEINKGINWIPNHIRDGQMGHMLATAPDWSISRNRFWGTPIPVWKGDKGGIRVFGSIAELEEFFGDVTPSNDGVRTPQQVRGDKLKISDLHRPFIDTLVKTDEHGETWKRVEDVFDCWFESGSMPFAQVHYPFENKEWFEDHFPADFITEYVGQTRGWFNTLIMLSTALFDKAPFKNCICHGVVLDSETGLKYSKRLKNYKDPMEVMDKFGADALRWLMISSPVMRGMDLSVDPEGKFIRDVVRLYIKPIWNAYNFFCLYANADGIQAKEATNSTDLMDRYILAKCGQAVDVIRTSLDAYDTPAACDAMVEFFEVLNNWYIRRNKERFWKEEQDADKQAAYDTLYTVLSVMCRAAAPLLPLTLDDVYKGLTGESVHLADFPDMSSCGPRATQDLDSAQSHSDSQNDDKDIVAQMDWVRDVCNAALAIRNKVNIRVRQPLQTLQIVTNNPILEKTILSMDSLWATYTGIITDEINTKQLLANKERLEEYATLKLSLNNQVLGKRLPALMKQIIPASKKGEWKQVGGTIEICGETLLPEEYTIQLEPKGDYAERAQALSTNDALVILDTNVTPELEAEGIARDLVRMIQQARKDANFNVSDRITLAVNSSDKILGAAKAHATYISEQTLAKEFLTELPSNADFTADNELDNQPVKIAISKCA